MAAEFTVKDIRNILIRRKKTIILTSVISVVILFGIVFFSKPKPIYEAVSAIKIGRPVTPMAEVLLGGKASPPVSLNAASSIIKGFECLSAVARKFNIIPSTVTKDEIITSSKYMREIKNLESMINTSPDKSSSGVLIIRVHWSNPQVAKDMANSIAEIYEEIDFYERNKSIIESKKIIEEKLNQEEMELEQNRENLRNYKLNLELGDVINDTKVIVDRIVEKQRKIKSLQKEIPILTEGRKILEKQLVNSRYLGWNHIGATYTFNIFANLNEKLKDLRLKELTLLIDYNPEHPEVKAVREQMGIVIKQMLADIEIQTAQYKEELVLLEKTIADLQPQLKEIPDRAKRQSILERNVKITADLCDKLAAKLQELSIKESEMVSNVKLVRYAIEQNEPINRVTTTGNFILSLFLSIVFGFIGGMIHEALDTIPHRPEDVADIFGVPILTSISRWVSHDHEAVKRKYPGISTKDRERYLSLASHFLVDSSIAEQFRVVVPNLLMQRKENGIQVISILNAIKEEGSTVFASNLAISLSQTGRTAVLVEMDFRNPSLHNLFGIENTPGLQDILLGNCELDMAVKKVTDLILGEINPKHLMAPPGLDSFYLLTSGGKVDNPSNYLNSLNMEETIEQLKNAFDFVIVNAPPALIYSEAYIVVAKTDATILLTESEKLSRKVLHSFRDQLETLKVRVLGLVVNKTKKVV